MTPYLTTPLRGGPLLFMRIWMGFSALFLFPYVIVVSIGKGAWHELRCELSVNWESFRRIWRTGNVER